LSYRIAGALHIRPWSDEGLWRSDTLSSRCSKIPVAPGAPDFNPNEMLERALKIAANDV
jgi:hypothetical protein